MARPPRRDDRHLRRLFEAIQQSDVDTVDDLLYDHGNQALEWTLMNRTVLQEAVEHGTVDMVKFLVKNGVDVNQTLWNGDTMLHLAVKRNSPNITRTLLDLGINMHKKDLNGQDALNIAMSENLPEVARVIITHGNDPTITYQRASVCRKYAVENHMPEMFNTMEDLMESFDQYDPHFGLYVAIMENNHRRILELLDQQVDPFALRLGKIKMSALHVAARQRDVSILGMMLAKVTQMKAVDAQDDEGQTPLHYAVKKNIVLNVDWLLFVGADPDIKDKRRKLPEDLNRSRALKTLFKTYWDSVPDAIIQMRGDWKAELPRARCAFARGGSQEFDPYIPPVLMVRCFTEESENEERNEFEDVAFQFDETCLEVYEYRCTRPCSVIYRVNLNGLNFNPQQQKLVMKVKDGNEPVCIGPELVVEEDEAFCDVDLSAKGMLGLVCRTHHRVSSFAVGPECNAITLDDVSGFELEIPEKTFHKRQEILVKVEEVNHKYFDRLLHKQDYQNQQNQERRGNDGREYENVEPDFTKPESFEFIPENERRGNTSLENEGRGNKNLENEGHGNKNLENEGHGNTSLENEGRGNKNLDNEGRGNTSLENEEEINRRFPLINISSFYSILNTANETPHNSLKMIIPLEVKNESNNFVTLKVTKTDPKASACQEEMLEGNPAEEIEHAEGGVDSSVDAIENDYFENETWDVLDTEIIHEQSAVKTQIDVVGTVVAAEVRPGVKLEDVVQVVKQLYSRQKKEEIFIYAMAKPFPGNRAQIIVCFVSATLYEDSLERFEADGYRNLTQPVVAYTVNRETFCLKGRSELKFEYGGDIQIGSHEVCKTCRPPTILDIEDNINRLGLEVFLTLQQVNRTNGTEDLFEGEAELEYQIGGRQNYSSFILKLNREMDAFCVMEITRRERQQGESMRVGVIPLDLSVLFEDTRRNGRAEQSTSILAELSNTDRLLQQLSTILSTDWTRIYCHALGLTKNDIQLVYKGQSLSPKDKNFTLLSKVKSTYRSETAFLSHLLQVLKTHKEDKSVNLLQNHLDSKQF